MLKETFKNKFSTYMNSPIMLLENYSITKPLGFFLSLMTKKKNQLLYYYHYNTMQCRFFFFTVKKHDWN